MKTLREQCFPVTYPIKTVYATTGPLVSATLPSLDTIKVCGYEQNKDVIPSNAIKRDFSNHFVRGICHHHVEFILLMT